MTLDPKMTLEEAQALVRSRMVDGVTCPCCGQLAKLYRRKINSGMANGLCLFLRRYGGTQEYVHVPSQTELSRLGGDWAKLAWWKLIEEKPSDREDGGPHAGWWRLTRLGVRFVAGQCRVPRYAYVYNGSVLRMDENESVSISDALGAKFDWRELMKGVDLPPPEDPEERQLGLFGEAT